MTPLVLAFIFVLMAFLLLLLDLLIPSGGILATLALVSAIAADLFAFRDSCQTGIWILIGELLAIPVAVWIFARYWTETPVGRRMVIDVPVAQPFQWKEEALVGSEGIALDDFFPTGRVEIDAHRYDAIVKEGQIRRGDLIRVVGEEMGQLFVIKTEKTYRATVEPTLDQPASELGLESID